MNVLVKRMQRPRDCIMILALLVSAVMHFLTLDQLASSNRCIIFTNTTTTSSSLSSLSTSSSLSSITTATTPTLTPPSTRQVWPAVPSSSSQQRPSHRRRHHRSRRPSIPKIVWLYWEQGLHHLHQRKHVIDANNDNGDDVSENNHAKYMADYHCVQAWNILNPTWDIRLLNQTQASQLAPKFAHVLMESTRPSNGSDGGGSPLCATKLSDLLRLELLSLYGGVYVDTSTCPLWPLDDFVWDKTRSNGFFAPTLGHGPPAPPSHHPPPRRQTSGNAALLDRPSELLQFQGCEAFAPEVRSRNESQALAARSRSISTWFLVAHAHHELIDPWLDAYYQRLLNITRDPNAMCGPDCQSCTPYFTSHCLFTLQRLYHPHVQASYVAFRRGATEATGGGAIGGTQSHNNRTTIAATTNKNNNINNNHMNHNTRGFCLGATRIPGQTIPTNVSKHVHTTLERCLVVKKQMDALSNFVRSSAYLDAMRERAPSMTMIQKSGGGNNNTTATTRE